MGRQHGPARRQIVQAGLAAVGWVALRRAAAAQRQLSKSEAQYQDSPKDIQMCSTCTLFVQPNACNVVDGDIKPDGWCRLFDMAD